MVIAQRFFDPSNRFVETEENGQAEIFLKEFVTQKIYGCKVVVTNLGSGRWTGDLIYEIPQGAVPMMGHEEFKVSPLELSAFSTSSEEFYFYFPTTGSYSIFPASAVKGQKVFGQAKTETLEVRSQLSEKKKETLTDVLSTGSTQDVLEFVSSRNLLNPAIFNFGDIYWLLRNKDFYEKFITLLKNRGIYDEISFSFAIHHGDIENFKIYLEEKINSKFKHLFRHLDFELISADCFEFLDYAPLINSRAHAVSQTKINITNNSFKETYTNFMLYLIEKGSLSNNDQTVLAIYLIMQDRFQEAIDVFEKIDKTQLKDTLIIQYDYLSAYIDFLTGSSGFKIAREISEKYKNYPVSSWRNAFIEVAKQIQELDQGVDVATIESAKLGENAKKAEKAISLTCSIKDGKIDITSSNLSSVVVKYYKTDVETLFSLNPFKSDSKSSLGFIKPFLSEGIPTPVTKDGESSTIHVSIPKEIEKESLFIEVGHYQTGFAKSVFLEYTHFDLETMIQEDFGILRVFEPANRRGVPLVYVKCFAKFKDGKVGFYKDGYTDIRGVFDYVSLNSDKLDTVEKFSIMLLDEKRGVKLIETAPPAQLGRRLPED